MFWYLQDKESKASKSMPKIARSPSRHIEVAHLLEGDKDKDESLSLHEFVELMTSQSLGITAGQACSMFKHADKNGDGDLNVSEIEAVVVAAKEKSMQVPVRLIVPSTTGVNVAVCEESLRKRRDRVIAMLAGYFGGATAAGKEVGAYLADSGEIVYEEVVSVTSFATPQGWLKHCDAVHAAVVGLCKEWGQECMGLEFDGVLEYVIAEEPSAEDLWKSVVPRLAKLSHKGAWKIF